MEQTVSDSSSVEIMVVVRMSVDHKIGRGNEQCWLWNVTLLQGGDWCTPEPGEVSFGSAEHAGAAADERR